MTALSPSESEVIIGLYCTRDLHNHACQIDAAYAIYSSCSAPTKYWCQEAYDIFMAELFISQLVCPFCTKDVDYCWKVLALDVEHAVR